MINTDLNLYFQDNGGVGEYYSIFILIGDTQLEIPVSQRRSIGQHYINLTPNAAQIVVLNTVQAGDTIEFAIGRGLSLSPALESRVRSDIQSGIPDINARVRTTKNVQVRSDISSGVPSVDARVRQTRQVRVRSNISSGIPDLDTRVRTTRDVRVRSNIRSGSVDIGSPYSYWRQL